MWPIGKEKKQSLLIPQKIRKAAFVPIKLTKREKLKYLLVHRLNIKVYERCISWKRGINTIAQKPFLWASFVDWKKVKKDLIGWFIESLLEGLTANFATHYLLGWQFNVMTVMAHGFAIKQGLSIYWRLRKDGTVSKIPEKD